MVVGGTVRLHLALLHFDEVAADDQVAVHQRDLHVVGLGLAEPSHLLLRELHAVFLFILLFRLSFWVFVRKNIINIW